VIEHLVNSPSVGPEGNSLQTFGRLESTQAYLELGLWVGKNIFQIFFRVELFSPYELIWIILEAKPFAA